MTPSVTNRSRHIARVLPAGDLVVRDYIMRALDNFTGPPPPSNIVLSANTDSTRIEVPAYVISFNATIANTTGNGTNVNSTLACFTVAWNNTAGARFAGMYKKWNASNYTLYDFRSDSTGHYTNADGNSADICIADNGRGDDDPRRGIINDDLILSFTYPNGTVVVTISSPPPPPPPSISAEHDRTLTVMFSIIGGVIAAALILLVIIAVTQRRQQDEDYRRFDDHP